MVSLFQYGVICSKPKLTLVLRTVEQTKVEPFDGGAREIDPKLNYLTCSLRN